MQSREERKWQREWGCGRERKKMKTGQLLPERVHVQTIDVIDVRHAMLNDDPICFAIDYSSN